MTRKTRKVPRRKARKPLTTEAKVRRVVKRLATTENVLNILTGIVIPIVCTIIQARTPPIIID